MNKLNNGLPSGRIAVPLRLEKQQIAESFWSYVICKLAHS